jgi:hypothetical protein
MDHDTVGKFEMASVFYTLALLACPVGMGLMMLMMMRGHNKSAADQASSPTSRDEVDALRAEIEALKTDHAARASQHPIA